MKLCFGMSLLFCFLCWIYITDYITRYIYSSSFFLPEIFQELWWIFKGFVYVLLNGTNMWASLVRKFSVSLLWMQCNPCMHRPWDERVYDPWHWHLTWKTKPRVITVLQLNLNRTILFYGLVCLHEGILIIKDMIGVHLANPTTAFSFCWHTFT